MTRLVWLAAAVIAAAVAPLAGDNYVLRLATTFCMYATLALSWNLIGGLAGYPSFATAAFFGIGAYVNGIAQSAGWPWWAAWPAAALFAALFALALGSAILHLRGHYFAIASLVVADVLRELVNAATGLTGGGMGLNLPLATGDVVQQARFYYAAMLALALGACAIGWWVARSPLGFGLRCIAQNEDAALMLGVHTRGYKVAAFTLASLLAAGAGAVYASWVAYIDPTDVFDVLISVKPIIMVLLGGAGTLLGPVVGAAVFLAAEELLWRNLLEFHAGLLGVLVVLLVLFLPAGLRQARLPGITRLRLWLRRGATSR
jgi:branched-chain amino acid transport system permease protein